FSSLESSTEVSSTARRIMVNVDNSPDCASVNNFSGPSHRTFRVKKEEPMDDYGEGMNKDSRIAHLKTRLIECEQRAKKAEEEHAQATAQEMKWIEKSAESESERVSLENQLRLLLNEKEEAARAEKAVTEKFQKEVMKKYEAALAWKGKMKEELEQSKADLEKARNDWNVKLDKMARVANSDRAEYEQNLKDMGEKYESALASSSESVKLVEEMKIQKRGMEEELRKFKVDREKSMVACHERLDKIVKGERAQNEQKVKEVMEKYEADLEKAQNGWNGKFDKMRNKAAIQKNLKEMREKYESAFASSRDSEGLLETMKSEKKRLEEELGTAKANLDKAQSDWHFKMDKILLGERANNETKLWEKKEKYEADLEKARKEFNGKLEESEKTRMNLEESLKKEREERSSESREAWKRLAELKIENEDLQDQVKELKKLTGRLGSDKGLVEQREGRDDEVAKLRAVNDWAENELKDVKKEARLKQEELMNELEEMRKINGLLATTPSGKIHSALICARMQIEHLEKEVEAATPKATDSSNKRRRRPEETVDKENRRRSSRIVSRSIVDSEKDGEPLMKKSRSDSTETCVNHSAALEQTTPQCALCEQCPETALEFAMHLRRSHSSSLEENRIYLICSCGYEVRSVPSDSKHNTKSKFFHFKYYIQMNISILILLPMIFETN
ncbi:hypothetical protein PENTCL1PPCAC_8217, partial [Pristionchus entomophagus]